MVNKPKPEYVLSCPHCKSEDVELRVTSTSCYRLSSLELNVRKNDKGVLHVASYDIMFDDYSTEPSGDGERFVCNQCGCDIKPAVRKEE